MRGNRPIPPWLLLALLLPLLLAGAHAARAQTLAPDGRIPPGFYLLDHAPGVELFRKDYPGGNPDYVQVIDLSLGARLDLMHGEITDPRPTKGDWGGADPRMTSLPIQRFWEQAKFKDPNLFCVTNGLFFYMPEYPTRLAFPLKVAGELVAGGWGIKTYPGEHLMLALWADHADISALTTEALQRSSAPDIIGGLTEEANKKAKFSVGRTFVGVKDRDGDGFNETVLIYNTLTAKQSGAADVLREFGAEKVMMLDGGGSTQLLCRGGHYIESDRPLPQMIAIVAASRPPVQAKITDFTPWAVIGEGERLPVELEIRNTGTLTWTRLTTSFLLQTGRLEFQEQQSLSQPVAPGATTALSQTLTLFQPPGVHPVNITLTLRYRDRDYPQGSLPIQVAVLPYQLSERKTELETLLSGWLRERPAEAADLVAGWIASQPQTNLPPMEISSQERANPINIVYVPLLMLPFMALIAWVIAHGKGGGAAVK